MALTEYEHYQLLQAERIHQARNGFRAFTDLTIQDPEWTWTPFHETYYKVLDMFTKGKIKRLIVTVPPQHGKSEGSSRRLPAFMLGQNPKLRMALASYGATFASKFNRQIQRIITSDEYQNIFPETTLNSSNVVTIAGAWLRNSEEFEVVGHGGFFKAVGVGGALTGNTIDVLVMDDLYKDYQDATSPTVSERVWEWYLTVAKTRLHNDSQELIVFTRWDENDLVGRLEDQGKVIELGPNQVIEDIILEEGQFLKINFPAIQGKAPSRLDPREVGEPLFPQKHGLNKLIEARELDPQKFSALHQGEPRAKEGLMYRDFNTFTELPSLRVVNSYTDTADTGSDYLVSVIYGIPMDSKDDKVYLIDVYCTQDAMEITEPETAIRHDRFQVRKATIESNNGGRGFARRIDDLTTGMTDVRWFHQSKNKEARIFSNSASVNNTMSMPLDWQSRWPIFAKMVMNHKKDAKNKHDDPADTITGIYETEKMVNTAPSIIW